MNTYNYIDHNYIHVTEASSSKSWFQNSKYYSHIDNGLLHIQQYMDL